MTIRDKVEKLERRLEVVKPNASPCQTCAGLWLVIGKEYGAAKTIPPSHSLAGCAELHGRIAKIYGGGEDDGLKAAA